MRSSLVLGVGMAISLAPLTTTVMGAVKTSQAGVASGINNAISRTAGLLSIAVLSLCVLSSFNHSLDERLATLNIPPDVQQMLNSQRINLAGAKVPPGLSNEMSGLLRRAIAESFVDSFRSIMFIAVGLALASAIVAFLMIKGRITEPSLRR